MTKHFFSGIRLLGFLFLVGCGEVVVQAPDGSSSTDNTSNANATLDYIRVTPGTSIIDTNAYLQLVATGGFSDNTTQNLSASVNWSIDNSAVASISPTGLLQGLTAGTVMVTASDGEYSDSAVVTVSASAISPDSISVVAPSNVNSLQAGASIQLDALGDFGGSGITNINDDVTWVVSDSSIASISADGVLTALSAGVVTVTATSGSVSQSITITINSPPVTLTSILVSPVNSAVDEGSTVQLMAVASYSDGTTSNVNGSVSWAVNDTAIASINTSGLLTALTQGVVTVTANDGAISSSATVTVNSVTTPPPEVTMVGIAVTPVSSSVVAGATVQLVATGTFSDNTTANINSTVSWSTSDTGIATVSNTGLVSTLSTGMATVNVSFGAFSDSATITVSAVPVVLQSIGVSAASNTAEVGDTVQMSALGNYSDNSTANITNEVNWSVSDPAIASIDSNGILTILSAGVVTVTATDGNISNTASVTVSSGVVTLQSIAITPANGAVSVGSTLQFTAIGTYSDNSTADITNLAGWSINVGIASIASGGLLTATGEGTVTVTAQREGVSSSVDLVINLASVTLQSIAVTPATNSVQVGGAVQLTATGTYSDNSTTDISSTVSWTVSDSNLASINNSGLLNANADGAVTVTATSGAVSNTASVTIDSVPVTLQSIAVTPATSAIEVNDTLQFVATATYSDNSTVDVSSSVSWNVDTGIASINGSGLLTASSDGVVNVTATSNGISGAGIVTVNPVVVTLQSISVSPSSLSLTAGAAQQLTAIGTYSDSTTADITSSVQWTPVDVSIVTISTAGLVNGGSIGTTNASASLSGVTSNSIEVTVTAAVAASLQISEVSEGGSGNGFWFELYNPSTVAVDLGQYAIKSGNLSAPEAMPAKVVPPGAYLVIMTQDLFDFLEYSISYEGTPNVVILPEQNFGWNTSGYIELLEGSETIDFVRFGSSNVAPTTASAWNGGAAPALTNNFEYHQSIARDTSQTDTDSASDWTLKDYSSIGGPNDISCITDADGDGIPDCSEVAGSTFAGMDLYAMGARVNQKDLFVEIDYMDPAGTTDTDIDGMLPQREVLDKITAEFLAHGFHVHFDVGDYFDQNPGLDPLDYDLGGGGYVPFAEKIMFRFFGYEDGSHLDPAIADILVYKAKHMELKRRQFFYYIVFAYSHAQGASGVSEVNGNDSFIALGSWELNRDNTQKTNQLINYQSGTLMHEFGHALGLEHGGFESANDKPNYLSTMNYLYATNGLPALGNNEGDRYYLNYNPGTSGNWDCKINLGSNTLVNGPFDDWTQFGLGFSDGSSFALDEVAGVSEALGYGRANSAGVDFNCDGDTDDFVSNFDLNEVYGQDEVLSVLNDYDDWGNIELFFSGDLRHVANGVSRDSNLGGKKIFVGKDWGKQPKIYVEPAIPNRKASQERQYRQALQRAKRKVPAR